MPCCQAHVLLYVNNMISFNILNEIINYGDILFIE
jgi:hypothetical protein